MPHSMRCYLEFIGAHYAEMGFTVSTGNAPGSDQLFALGAGWQDASKVELYLPWQTFERKAILEGNQIWVAKEALDIHLELAESATNNWKHKSDAVKLLLIRDAMIVVRWNQPVDLVLAYPDYSVAGWGGTGHTMRVAGMLGIPVWLIDRGTFWSINEGMPTSS